MRKTKTDLLANLDKSDEEIAIMVGNLIRRREQERDTRLRTLDLKAKELVGAYRAIARDRLLEEISCFKEVLALHRQLNEDDDPPGN